MINITSKGSFQKTDSFLKRMSNRQIFATLDRFGAQGVAALKSATPVDSSDTANAWTYKITRRRGYYSIVWHNTNLKDGIPIAVLLQYGHGTRSGGYIQGRDYINPVIKPIFDQITAEAWKVVKQ